MNFKQYLQLILFASFLNLSIQANAYLPVKLVNIPTKLPGFHIYDPQNYIDEKYLPELSDKIKRIQDGKNFDVYLYIFSSIADYYGSKGEKNIELFANDLSYMKTEAENQKDDKSIFIIFSVSDRQSRVRTGRIVKNYLQERKLSEYLTEIKFYLQIGSYGRALVDLMKNIEIRVFTNWQLLQDLWDLIKTILYYMAALAFCCLILYLIGIFTKPKTEKKIEDKLNKLKKITQNGKPRKEILDTMCVICLDELEKPEEKLKQDESEKEKLQKENNLINETNSADNKEKEKFVAKLECGHSFHSTCIAEWMIKNNKCPTCREIIDKENNKNSSNDKSTTNTSHNTNTNVEQENTFIRSLLAIQTLLHPELNNYNFGFGSSTFSWTRRPAISDPAAREEGKTKSTYSSSWGSKSGGASSSW
jgi:hypothetical protein